MSSSTQVLFTEKCLGMNLSDEIILIKYWSESSCVNADTCRGTQEIEIKSYGQYAEFVMLHKLGGMAF